MSRIGITKNGPTLLALVALLSLLSADGRAEEFTEAASIDEFARGRELRIETEAGLQTVLLDADVYLGSVEVPLNDLRVFNAANEVLPHAIRTLGPAKQAPRPTLPLPLFRLYPDEAPETGAPATTIGAGSYRIDADVTGQGANIRIRSNAPGSSPAPVAPIGFLLDTDAIQEPIEALELVLDPDEDDLVVQLRVEGSDDLTHFETLVSKAALARIEQDGFRIERDSIDLPPTRYRFLRLTWPASNRSPRLDAVRARVAPERSGPTLRRVRSRGKRPPDQLHTLIYDLGGWFPVDHVELILPKPNTLISAQLYTGPSPEGPWRRRFDGLVYSLERGETMNSPPIDLGGGRVRFVKLSADPTGGGLATSVPTLQASWHPEQLVFVPRGNPPYTLVYGLKEAPRSAFETADLLRITKTHERTLALETARLGPVREIAGDAAFEARAKPIPSRTLALWAVLVGAVALVLGLAVRLLRQLR